MFLLEAVLEGLKKSWKLCLKLFKIIIPVSFVVALLKYTGLLLLIAKLFEPLMIVFGLPGDTALALILANGINIYASLVVIETLTFTLKEITILSVMICLSHSLFIETSILKHLKMPRSLHALIRITASVTAGIIINLLWRV